MQYSRFIFFFMTIILLAMLVPNAYAANDVMVLPSGIDHLEEETFLNCSGIRSVVAPEGLHSIGDRTFSGCENLLELTLPASLQKIGEDVLADAEQCIWVHCPPNSTALAWAKSIPLDYDAETAYRALIIGQTYTGTNQVLYGPANDARAVRFGLGNLQRTQWQTTTLTNVSSSKLLSSIAAAFSSATENDVSLLYYSGHGLDDGSLQGSDLKPVSPSALRAAMDTVPGRKIIIVDACYSGNLIARSTAQQTQAANPGFRECFVSAFSVKARGALNASEYYVICSAGPRETALEGSIQSGSSTKIMGFFTYSLCRGIGWDGITSRACESAADVNKDNAVSFLEAANYAIANAKTYNSEQNGTYYPAGVTWFSPFRYS